MDGGESEELEQIGVEEDQRDCGHPRVSWEVWAGLGDTEGSAVRKDTGLR